MAREWVKGRNSPKLEKPADPRRAGFSVGGAVMSKGGQSNSFADKYPAQVNAFCEEYARLDRDCLGVEHAKGKFELVLTALSKAGLMLHLKPPPKTVKVGMASEESGA